EVISIYEDTLFGTCVLIDHGNGVQTLYAHSNDIKVSEGDTVKQGQIIGLVGDTGNTTAPHLHFEVRLESGNGYQRANPLRYISEP
ncbi:MAG: M23 family metallopeptidase, partial [Acutalibacteraceae bacterium]|nr:M23 family metallopeptidase [Acutalibacteraceae bacterium]